jgi:methionyl-tRNA formyltransferase
MMDSTHSAAATTDNAAPISVQCAGTEPDTAAKPTTDIAVARIALFTVRSFAIEHAIAMIQARPDAELACVLTCTGPQSRRSTAHCEVMEALYKAGLYNVDVIVSNKKSKWADLIANYDANVVFCSGFPWLIPESVLNDPRLPLGVINFHNSLLPKLMGPNAFGWQIVLNQEEVGYCVHRMSSEFDTGPILFTETVPLDVNEDYQDLQKKMPAVYRGMVDKAITMALERHPGFPQVGTPSAAPKFAPEFRWIDFTAPAREAHNKVRAYFGVRDHPHGALAKLNGEVVCITKTRYNAPIKLVGVVGAMEDEERQVPSVDDTTVSDEVMSLTTASIDSDGNVTEQSYSNGSSILPGTILARHGDSFIIQCGDTSLEVLKWHKVE